MSFAIWIPGKGAAVPYGSRGDLGPSDAIPPNELKTWQRKGDAQRALTAGKLGPTLTPLAVVVTAAEAMTNVNALREERAAEMRATKKVNTDEVDAAKIARGVVETDYGVGGVVKARRVFGVPTVETLVDLAVNDVKNLRFAVVGDDIVGGAGRFKAMIVGDLLPRPVEEHLVDLICEDTGDVLADLNGDFVVFVDVDNLGRWLRWVLLFEDDDHGLLPEGRCLAQGSAAGELVAALSQVE